MVLSQRQQIGPNLKLMADLDMTSGEGKPRVLVIEDSEPMNTYLTSELTERGWNVTSVRHAEDVRKLIPDIEDFSLVICDRKFPENQEELVKGVKGQNVGDEIIREIKKKAGDKVKVIIFSTTLPSEDEQLKIGADHYISKIDATIEGDEVLFNVVDRYKTQTN